MWFKWFKSGSRVVQPVLKPSLWHIINDITLDINLQVLLVFLTYCEPVQALLLKKI